MANKQIELPAPSTPAEIKEYVVSRLHGDTRKAPPTVVDFRDMEQVEDVLTVWYRSDKTNEKMRNDFWLVITDLANEALRNSESDVLNRVAKLAYVLPTPSNLKELPKIGPNLATELRYSSSEEAQCTAALLTILDQWKLRSDPEFWNTAVTELAGAMGQQPGVDVALQLATGTLSDIDVKLWATLFLCAINVKPYAQDLLFELMSDRWQRCKGNVKLESHLIEIVGASLAITRGVDPDDYEQQIGAMKELLDDWFELPWQSATSAERDRLRFELQRLTQPKQGKNKVQSNRQSPRSFIQASLQE